MRHRRPLDSVLLALLLTTVAGARAAEAQTDEPEAWWTVRSEHFVIWTDATPERGAEVARNLELFRSVFARLAPELELRNPTPTKIIAFRDGRAYAPYKPQPDSGGNVVLGYFLRHPDGNFLTLDAGTQLVGAFTVIYHEFVHYLVDHNFPKVPRWFNEGLAEYYSTFAVDGDRIYLGLPVERHVAWLRYDNDRRARLFSHDLSLRQVLTGEASEHGSKIGGFYAFSWALVHYLLSGGPERLDQTADFLLRLADGEDSEDAFERAFELRLDDLEETLRDYAYRLRLDPLEAPLNANETAATFPVSVFHVDDFGRQTAITVAPLAPQEILFHLGDLLTRMGRLRWAELHFQKALELDPRHPEAHAGLALVRDYESRFDEAEVLYRDALRLESADPLTYLRYGRHLLARLRPEEGLDLVTAGKLAVAGELASTSELTTREELRGAAELDAARRAFAKAVELDPDFVQARLLYGVSHLFGEVETGPGIAALEKVLRWQPDDATASFFLLQLFLKDGDFEQARRLYVRVFRDHAEAEVARRAEEEIERARLLHRASAALADDDAAEALRLFDQAIAVTTDQDLRDRMAERLVSLQERYATP